MGSRVVAGLGCGGRARSQRFRRLQGAQKHSDDVADPLARGEAAEQGKAERGALVAADAIAFWIDVDDSSAAGRRRGDPLGLLEDAERGLRGLNRSLLSSQGLGTRFEVFGLEVID